MARSPRYSDISYSIGPGAPTPAVKALIIINVATFLTLVFVPESLSTALIGVLGLKPEAVIEGLQLWQPVTYMFIHYPGAIGHVLFNMLGLWMFGTDLEHRWGTRFFVKYYFVTGI